jgi:hypothetical protein
MAKRKQIEFEEIPINDVPYRKPSTKPSSQARGSQWDNALKAVERGHGKRAIRIIERSPEKRKWLKSTLQTMARKRGCFVQVRNDDATSAVYAWASEKSGRFAPPRE